MTVHDYEDSKYATYVQYLTEGQSLLIGVAGLTCICPQTRGK